jgi:hypothetical protein
MARIPFWSTLRSAPNDISHRHQCNAVPSVLKAPYCKRHPSNNWIRGIGVAVLFFIMILTVIASAVVRMRTMNGDQFLSHFGHDVFHSQLTNDDMEYQPTRNSKAFLT